jgi:hypothetical protein
MVVAESQECHDLLKKNLNRVSCVRGCIVVMQSPRARFPFLGSLETNDKSQSHQNLTIVMLILYVTFRDVFIENNPFHAR